MQGLNTMALASLLASAQALDLQHNHDWDWGPTPKCAYAELGARVRDSIPRYNQRKARRDARRVNRPVSR